MSVEYINELISLFRTSVIEKEEATKNGDYVIVNSLSDTITLTFNKIISQGTIGREALIELVDDQNTNVSLMASVYSLRYNTEKCKKVLMRLSNEPGIVGFSARQSIINWDSGQWHLEDMNERIDKTEWQLADTEFGISDLSTDEMIEKLAIREDDMGEMMRGVQKRANMTEDEILALMSDNSDDGE